MCAMTMEGKYDYHIYGLIPGNRKKIQEYVADSPERSPLVQKNLSRLAHAINIAHCGSCDSHRKENYADPNFFSVSFEPTCERVIYRAQIYRVQRLSEKEQDRFLSHMRPWLGWLID